MNETSYCKACGTIDPENSDEVDINWIRCDKCQGWYHFTCVQVNDSIAKNLWLCEECVDADEHTPQIVHLQSGDSDNQQQISSALSLNDALTHTPIPSVEQTVKHNNKSSKITTRTTAISERANVQSRSITREAENALGSTRHSLQTGNATSGNTLQNLLLSRLEEEQRLKEDYINKKYAILSQMGDDNINKIISKPSELSTNQIAARQAILKELPTFSGEPDDWLSFISSYEYSTKAAGFSDTENMLRLQKCLKGKAKELVKDKLLIPSMVDEVIATLKLFFGRPEHIIERMVERVRKTQPPKDKLESLIEFALTVWNLCATIEACNLQAHMNNPALLKELVEKLPNNYKLNWAMHIRKEPAPTIKDFSDWIYGYAEIAAIVVSPASIKMHAVHTHVNNSDAADVKRKCIVCNEDDHATLTECDKFKTLTLKKRLEVVMANELCRRCLKRHRRRCFRTDDCGINGCTSKHNPLLHDSQNNNTKIQENKHGIVSAHQTLSEEENTQYFRIVPVKLHGKNKIVEIFAFLDEGSSVTLIDDKIFAKLGLEGTPKPLCLQWTGDTTRMENESLCASIRILNHSASTHKYWLNNVQTVSNLSLPRQSIDARYLKGKFVHFSDIPIQSYDNAEPGILIGSDNWKVAVPRKVCEGKWNEPIASKCRLGWAIQGGNKITKKYVNAHKRCDCEALNEAVKNSFNLERSSIEISPTPEEQKALQNINETCVKKDGKFEVGLLWSEKHTHLPESYEMAFKRLKCLDKRLAKEPSLKQIIQTQINNLLSKGYVKKLSLQDLANCKERVWYLPIFIVKNPNKPKKVRLVWDAAAKTQGVSLNDFLVSGPDLLKSLVDVLTAFRVGKIAVCGDISEMFHRINIKDSDMHVQRFLWRENGDIKNEPTVYVMKAMSFGIRCAPCIAHFVRNKNSEEYQQKYPRAFEAIQQAHYVDDFIDSMTSEEEAIEISNQVRLIHAAGGFHIRNWTSNSTKVLERLLGESAATQSQVEIGNAEKVLGMFWDPNLDIFLFIFRFARMKRNIVGEPAIPTKREILQILMSMFDPLGFLSCGWETQLHEELNVSWERCKETMQAISSLQIPRCYSPKLFKANEVQLHTFVDAGEDAYAAVCYLRITYNENITTSLVIAKSKVAPLKPLSVPRLELQAAVIGTRLAQNVQKIRRLRINSSFYWSDSKTVLRWLNMDPKGFQQFVMYRVGEILEATDVNQWHWVPSKLNAADQVTKVKTKINSDFWLHGPEFLRKKHHEWPSCDDFGETDTSELKKHVLYIHKNITSKPLCKFNRFSSWHQLYRSIAALIFCVERRVCLKSNKKPPKTPFHKHYTKAKTLLIKEAQKSMFENEIHAIKNEHNISRQSSLIKLQLYLNDDGILTAKGRAESLNSREGVIVLPKESYITFLIVRSYHEKAHHVAHETTINLIRSDFYIPKLRVLYKKVRSNCQWCKNNLAKPEVPQMAPLPAARMASFKRAFSYVGVDYFRPILVNVARRKEKRWGVIFTCLTLRAVHIEIAHSLDTSSCIMCINNFISRRGTPIEIYSDNGTNFKGAEKVINEHIQNINFPEIIFKYDNIRWHFNPPSAPHMGGVWERLIRSIKTVLKNICPSANFNDESLKSALCEIEFLINSRPLTFVSLDSEDDEALTPNHVLLGSASSYKPIGYDNGNLRWHWKQSKVFVDYFWHRWVKEYLPIITRRAKWFEKRPPIKVGDVVTIVDENLPKNCWPKGRIVGSVVAKDGQVRRVTIKTQHGLMIRPVAKVAVLDVGIDECKLNQRTFSYAGEDVAAV